MVDREKVIRGTEICLSGGLPQRCIECPYHYDGCDRQRMIDTLEVLKEQPQWISVKDRLPEIDEDVLILYKSKVLRETGYAITCLKDSFYFGSTMIPYQTPQWNEPWQYFRENNVITHWMELPKPPEEEQG